MSSSQDPVLDLIREMLENDPDADLREMYAEARKLRPDIGDLSLRSFSARYPLRVKREWAAAPASRSTRRRAKADTVETNHKREEMIATKQGSVMEMVEEALARDPQVSTEELFERAKEMDPSMKELNSRQFNARFPLQVKRRMAAVRGGGQRRPRRKKQAVDTSQVRKVLLDFAQDIAGANDSAEVIEVIGNLDQYVDKMVAAVK